MRVNPCFNDIKADGLLLGFLALLTAISGLMYPIRQVDWYAYGTIDERTLREHHGDLAE
jgi:inner membrane protein involved in colicin E2 resistance